MQKVEGQKVPHHRRPMNQADMTKKKGSLFRALLVFCAANWGTPRTPKVLERFLADDHDVKSASVFLRLFFEDLGGLTLIDSSCLVLGRDFSECSCCANGVIGGVDIRKNTVTAKRSFLDHRQVGCSWPWGMTLDGHGGWL